MKSIRARPTTYCGISMRSRLEASWAAAFDNHDLPWEYEPRAFADESGQYLPDFYLSTRDLFVEIKPSILGEDPFEHPVLRRMEIIWSSLPDARLAVFFGSPDAQPCNLLCERGRSPLHDQHLGAIRTDSSHQWWARFGGHDFYLWNADPSQSTG